MFKLLGIGNSFTDDSFEWVYPMLISLGLKDLAVNNLYIGGCSIDQHLDRAENDLPDYDYRRYEKGLSSNNFRIREALKIEDWQYITLQQASHDSGILDSYKNLPKLIEYVKKYKPENSKFYWIMTWAYKNTSTHPAFGRYNSDQLTMYNKIVDCVKKNILTNNEFVKVIPTGTAIQNARTSSIGDNLNKDGFHLTNDLGRYIAALMVVCTILEIEPDTIPFTPDGVDPLRKKIALESVSNALKNPFTITNSKF